MLVLKRRANEAVRLGADVRIVVTRVARDSVTLGIDAPPACVILREELLEPGRETGPNRKGIPS